MASRERSGLSPAHRGAPPAILAPALLAAALGACRSRSEGSGSASAPAEPAAPARTVEAEIVVESVSRVLEPRRNRPADVFTYVFTVAERSDGVAPKVERVHEAGKGPTFANCRALGASFDCELVGESAGGSAPGRLELKLVFDDGAAASVVEALPEPLPSRIPAITDFSLSDEQVCEVTFADVQADAYFVEATFEGPHGDGNPFSDVRLADIKRVADGHEVRPLQWEGGRPAFSHGLFIGSGRARMVLTPAIAELRLSQPDEVLRYARVCAERADVVDGVSRFVRECDVREFPEGG